MLAAVLALSSSLVWGVSDFIGGTVSRRHSPFAILLVAESIGLAIAIAVVVIGGVGPPPIERMLPAAITGMVAGLGLASFFRGMAVGRISIVAPVAATGAIVPVAYGLLGGDRPKVLQLVGIVMAVAGVVLASREKNEAGGSTVSKGVGYALMAAFGFGCFYIGTDISSNHGDFLWATIATRVFIVPMFAIIVAVRHTSITALKPDMRFVIAIGCLDVTSNILIAAATSKGLISLVGVLGSLYPVVTVLLAMALLRERVAGAQLVGVVVALAGVVLITAY